MNTRAFGDPSGLPNDRLIEILLDANESVLARRAAARVLGIRGVEEAQPALIKLTRDADADLGSAADKALGRISKAIMAVAKKERDTTNRRFAQELKVDSNLNRLIDILRDQGQPSESRIKAFSVAGNLRVFQAVPFIIEGMSEGDPPLAWAAAHALIELGSRQATRPLMNIVRTACNDQSREAAVYTLWFLRDKRAEALLVRVLENSAGEGSHIRSLAAEALGGLSPTVRSRRILSQALLDASEEVSEGARCALARCSAVLRRN